MRVFPARRLSPPGLRLYATQTSPIPPLIRIENATFYRHHPSDSHRPDRDSPLYPNLHFTLPASSAPCCHWAILSSSSANRTAFLQILRGQHLSVPPIARTYPYLQSAHIAAKDARQRNPQHAIQYVGFDADRGNVPGGVSTKGAYMSARYESMRETSDWSVRDYLAGNTELNADEAQSVKPDDALVERIMRDLNLAALQAIPVSHLSNGQTRRARIAKALLAQPELLLLDGPFMGLDPHALQHLSQLLHQMAQAQEPRILLSLRPQDVIPDWITHFVVVGHRPEVSIMGDRRHIFDHLRRHYLKANETSIEFQSAYEELAKRTLTSQATERSQDNTLDCLDATVDEMLALYDIARKMQAKGDFDRFAKDEDKVAAMRLKLRRPMKTYVESMTRDGVPLTDTKQSVVPIGDPIVQMEGVRIKYNDDERAVVGNWKDGLWWEIRRGQRWGVFGPNGSGKTTLLSLITSDHPQTYSAPVKLFGRSRLPTPGEPGISIFDLQSRIGHSSPEVHAYFPKHITVRRVLESAWADTPLSKPRLDHDADERVNACLRWFRSDLCPEQGPTLDQRGEAFMYSRKSKTTIRDPRYFEVTMTTLRDEEMLLWPTLDWAECTRFGELSFSAQRVALFLRAVVKAPDLLVLDEAFSGMDELARDRCQLFLHHGEAMTLRHVDIAKAKLRPAGARPHRSGIAEVDRVRMPGLSPAQALVVVAHARDEVPGCVRDYLALPEPGTGAPARIGRLTGPLSVDWRRWAEVWAVDRKRGRPRLGANVDNDPRYQAVTGPSSPLEVYSNSLNVFTDLVGVPLSSQAALMRYTKQASKRTRERREQSQSKDENKTQTG